MGVKGLWNYVEHHNIQYVYPTKQARTECYGVHPRHLFLDMNAVMHIAYEPKAPTTAATLRAVAAKVDELLTKVRPQDTLVLAFDGVAPIAKLKTQKERRNSLSAHAPRLASSAAGGADSNRRGKGKDSTAGATAAASAWLSASMFTCDLGNDGVPLHREEILCGSEFVLACESYITTYLESRKAQYTWKHLRVCGCCVAGEGEVKISGLLRQLWRENVADGTYSPEDAITMIGNDSDLILVAMVAVPYSYYTLMDPYDFSLTSLHELMDHWSQGVPNPPLSPELLPSYRVDFVFLMLLAGDDYYEGIRGDSVQLWRRYRHLRANEGYFRRSLLAGPHLELDLEFLRALFARTGSMASQVARVPRNKRKTVKAVLRSGTGGTAKDGIQLLAAALWSMKGYVTGMCPDYKFQAQMEGCPTVGSLRMAAQSRGLGRRIGAGSLSSASPAKADTSHATAAIAAEAATPSPTTATVATVGGEAEASPKNDVNPVFTPLGQCLAILGVRGRYSVELRRALHTVTSDDGHSLTISTSVNFVTETVNKILRAVDVSRLTKAERKLNTASALRVEGVESGAASRIADDGAFMALAVVPSRSNVGPRHVDAVAVVKADNEAVRESSDEAGAAVADEVTEEAEAAA